MKICLLTHSLNVKDGEGRFSFDLIFNLKNSGQEIQTLTNFDLLKNPLINFFKIRKIFNDSDIIHAIDIWPNGFYARLISLGLKKSIIITSLGTYSVAPFYSWRRPLMLWACRKSKIIAISGYTKEEIEKINHGLNVEVICPGFDLNFWSGEGVGSQYQQYKPYILSVGALKPRKGYINSLQAFKIIVKQFQNLNYIIIGRGEGSEYVKNLKDFIKENGLDNKVFFVSSGIDDNELLKFYRNAELFILTPVEKNHHFEGFGIVYLEAAASGLPIIATCNSGAASAAKDGYNSILVPQNSPVRTAEAIIKILSDNATKEKFKNNSREWVKNFDWSKIIIDYNKIYDKLTKHN